MHWRRPAWLARADGKCPFSGLYLVMPWCPLKLGTVGVFILRKLENTANQGFFSRELVVKHLPAQHCLGVTFQTFLSWLRSAPSASSPSLSVPVALAGLKLVILRSYLECLFLHPQGWLPHQAHELLCMESMELSGTHKNVLASFKIKREKWTFR